MPPKWALDYQRCRSSNGTVARVWEVNACAFLSYCLHRILFYVEFSLQLMCEHIFPMIDLAACSIQVAVTLSFFIFLALRLHL